MCTCRRSADSRSPPRVRQRVSPQHQPAQQMGERVTVIKVRSELKIWVTADRGLFGDQVVKGYEIDYIAVDRLYSCSI